MAAGACRSVLPAIRDRLRDPSGKARKFERRAISKREISDAILNAAT